MPELEYCIYAAAVEGFVSFNITPVRVLSHFRTKVGRLITSQKVSAYERADLSAVFHFLNASPS